jgi:hypothetical protein
LYGANRPQVIFNDDLMKNIFLFCGRIILKMALKRLEAEDVNGLIDFA